MKIAAIIPCYKVKKSILELIQAIPSLVTSIYVVDDACPEESGKHVAMHCQDPRVKVIYHDINKGVGGAVMTGYRSAIADGMDILVKLDGDGQMNPALIASFADPITRGEADYTKGNRFFEIEAAQSMPTARMIGNIGLSFLTKMSSGYWNLFDPTNGYTAIHAKVAARIPFEKVSQRYFFESDLLFRLNTLRAVVIDIPMHAHYGEEESNMIIHKQIIEFSAKNIRNTLKRIYYNYFLRNFNFASIELVIGVIFLTFGIIFGSETWITSHTKSSYASAGTVMLAGLTTLIGTQLLLGFINVDINSIPSIPLHKRLGSTPKVMPPIRRSKRQ